MASASPLTLAALLDVLAERYGMAIARPVVAQLRLELGAAGHPVANEAVYRAIEMADDCELAVAGAAFLEHRAISAVADTAAFRAVARSVGLDAATLTLQARLRADAAFASAWRERKRQDPCFASHAAAVALMQETLLTLL